MGIIKGKFIVGAVGPVVYKVVKGSMKMCRIG